MKIQKILLLLITFASSSYALAADVSSFRETSFDSIATYSSYKFILGRMLPKRELLYVISEANKIGKSLDTYPVDPSDEKWLIYVPDAEDGTRYGVLVWIDGNADVDNFPVDWLQALEAKKVILVVAENVSDTSDFYSRVVPMALNGLNGIVRNYPVDGNKVWIGGRGKAASGALAMALGFPDIFKGTISLESMLRFGEDNLYVPDASSIEVARTNHYVFSFMGNKEKMVKENFSYLCMPNISVLTSGKFSLLAAISRLETPSINPENECKEYLHDAIEKDVIEIKSYIEKNEFESAINAWGKAYTRYGGLAEEKIDNLATSMLTAFGETGKEGADKFIYEKLRKNVYFSDKPDLSKMMKGR